MDVDFAVGGGDDDERIGEPVLAGFLHDQPFLFQCVHFGFVRRKENIGRRAFFDLPFEHAGCCKVEKILSPVCFSNRVAASLSESIRLAAAKTVTSAPRAGETVNQPSDRLRPKNQSRPESAAKETKQF